VQRPRLCLHRSRPATAGGSEFYGAGVDGNIVTASLKALVSGINRLGSAVQRQPVDQAA
jgi:2-isopropylmalate synthase